MDTLRSLLLGTLLPLVPIAAGHGVQRLLARLETRRALGAAAALYLGRMVLALAVMAAGLVACKAAPVAFVPTFIVSYLVLSFFEAAFFSPLRRGDR